MATYKFDQFKTEITDPVVNVQRVSDDIILKTCSVDVLLSVEGANFGVILQGFTY